MNKFLLSPMTPRVSRECYSRLFSSFHNTHISHAHYLHFSLYEHEQNMTLYSLESQSFSSSLTFSAASYLEILGDLQCD